MTQFLGSHQNRRDAKGRVSIPAPFRAALRAADAGVVSVVLRPSHTYPCVEAWPVEQFQSLATPLDTLPVFGEEHDDLATSVYGDAHPVDSDREGRIVLPDTLVAHAGLGEAVTFMGLGRIFQIWEPQAAERRRAEARARTLERRLTLPATGSTAVPLTGTRLTGTPAA